MQIQQQYSKEEQDYRRNAFNDELYDEHDIHDPENSYANILHDPRFQRYLQRYHPKLLKKGGLKRKAEKYVDPSHIPIFGIICNIHRARKSVAQKKKLEKIEASLEQKDLEDAFNLMKLGMKVHVAQATTTAAVAAIFQIVPVTSIFGQYLGNQLGKGASIGAKKGSKIGAKAATKETADEKKHIDENTAEYEALEGWETIRAFLVYLGLPKSTDELYAIWEDSRLHLKQLYGAKPEDDLSTQKPDKELEKEIKKQEDEGSYDLQKLNISLLVLLWRAFQCWDDIYYDKLTKADVRHITQKERMQDVQYVQHLLNPLCPQVLKLDEHHTREIVTLLLEGVESPWNPNHARLKFLKTDTDEPSNKEVERLRWFLEKFVTFWLKKQQIWGFVSDDHRILSLAFWQAPEHSFPSTGGFFTKTKAKGAFTIGLGGLNKLAGTFNEQEKLLKEYNKTNAHGVVHFFVAPGTGNEINPYFPESPTDILLTSLCDYISEPSYTFLYNVDLKKHEYLTKIGFKRVETHEYKQEGSDNVELILFRREAQLKTPINREALFAKIHRPMPVAAANVADAEKLHSSSSTSSKRGSYHKSAQESRASSSKTETK